MNPKEFNSNRATDGLSIRSVRSGTIANRMGIRPGWKLVSIDQERVVDILDVRFLTRHDLWTARFMTNGKRFRTIRMTSGSLSGITFEPLQVRRCGNRCIFCFVDQNPPGMRTSLYVKDEDLRYSFLFGNYVTLTEVTDQELNRIIKRRLSPLYVSVHSTSPVIRKKLLGNPSAGNILTKLKTLTRGRITLHVQIIVCPGYNDGADLERTLQALFRLHPRIASVAVVPVGLTKHRCGLTSLKAVTPALARHVISRISTFQERSMKKVKTRFVFLADEWYIKAGISLPHISYYEDFPQWENGVGIARSFCDGLKVVYSRFPERVTVKRRIALVCGISAQKYLREPVRRMNQIKNLNVELVPVQNNFYGRSITVTGLLTGRDIIHAVKSSGIYDMVFLPDVTLKIKKDTFLDDLSIDHLSKTLGTRVIPVASGSDGILEIVRILKKHDS